jgi:hypothetical protein
MTSHSRFSTPAIALLLALSACTKGSETTAPPPPEPAADVIHAVTILFDTLTVTGSCDHNSIFESPGDGEFVFDLAIRLIVPTGISLTNHFVAQGLSGTYTEGGHLLSNTASTTFFRNVTKNERFGIAFTAIEKDGLLGTDPQMAIGSLFVYSWTGSDWVDGDKARRRNIEFHNGKPKDCGVRLSYRIISVVSG